MMNILPLSITNWYKNVEKIAFKKFNILLNTINNHSILKNFDNRSTNASAECFNGKIKVSRSSI